MLTIICPAKVNLFLNILGKRNDMHILKMLNQSVSLFDIITLEKNDTQDITIVCDDDNIPVDCKNSVYKAVIVMKERYNISCGFNINIIKKIPTSAGLGGESTDAAGIILGINKLLKLNLSKNELVDVGLKVGSDVPFSIMGGTRIVESVGEKIKRAKTKYKYFLIIKPSFSISTKEMFNKYDEEITTYKKYSKINIGHNDFECVAPKDIIKIKEALLNSGAISANMTGSGSAVIGIFNDFVSQKEAYNKLKTKYNTYLVNSCNGVIIK